MSAYLTDGVSTGSNASGSVTIPAGGWASISASVIWSCVSGGPPSTSTPTPMPAGSWSSGRTSSGRCKPPASSSPCGARRVSAAVQVTGIIALEVN